MNRFLLAEWSSFLRDCIVANMKTVHKVLNHFVRAEKFTIVVIKRQYGTRNEQQLAGGLHKKGYELKRETKTNCSNLSFLNSNL